MSQVTFRVFASLLCWLVPAIHQIFIPLHILEPSRNFVLKWWVCCFLVPQRITEWGTFAFRHFPVERLILNHSKTRFLEDFWFRLSGLWRNLCDATPNENCDFSLGLDLSKLWQKRAGEAKKKQRMERHLWRALRRLSSLAAAFAFTLTGNSARTAALLYSRSASCSVLFILYLPPSPSPLQLIYSLAETSPWIIEMNDSTISLRIHITRHSRREKERKKRNKKMKHWEDWGW